MGNEMKNRRILHTAVLWSGVVAGSAIGAGQSATAGQIGSGIVTQGQIGSGVVADGQIGSGIALLKRQARDLVVVGAIDAVNPAAGTISVLGQTINVADAEQLYSLASNRVPVAVFGKASRDGAVDARVIVVAGREYVDGANTVFLKGRVSSLDLTTGVLYWVVQVAGGFVGGFLVWVLYKADFDGQGWKNVFYTAPGIHYGDATFNQYFSEFIGTFMLVLLIYAIVDNVRNVGPGANLWPFMVGMGVLAIGLSLGGPTGYAINPARDFGPRLFSGIFLSGDNMAFDGSYWLVPIIGPLVGGVAGAFFYDFLIKPLLPLPKEPEPQPRGADVAHEPTND